MTFSIVAFCVNHVFTFCIFWYFDIMGRSSCLERDLPLQDKLLPRDSKQLTSEWNFPMCTNPSKGPVPSQETSNQSPCIKNQDLDNRRPLLQPGILLQNVKWFDSMFKLANPASPIPSSRNHNKSSFILPPSLLSLDPLTDLVLPHVVLGAVSHPISWER